MIDFLVITGKPYTHNALLSGTRQARSMQTDAMHTKLRDYRTIPGYDRYLALQRTGNWPAALALKNKLERRAKVREQQAPQYWYDDVKPRKPVVSSSSWIGDVEYDQRGKDLYINIGAKKYTVPGQTAAQVKSFLESPSLGKYFNKHYRISR